MRILLSLILLITFLLQSCTSYTPASDQKIVQDDKKYDLVLVHGLANRHKWSESFLETCLKIWGSGNVFAVYTGTEMTVIEKNQNGRKLIIGGENNSKAGTDSISQQVANLIEIIKVLQDKHGLGGHFSIIGHSMGGLVARQYAYAQPETITGLVTLGTPHHGSPLANSFKWIGYFLNSTDAIEDLKPEKLARFNEKYPVKNTPFAFNNKIYTIRGLPDGTDCFGWAGELLAGWQILSKIYGTQSDGLVPVNSAVIDGAEHIADFNHCDHYQLVRQPDVVLKAAHYLP